MAKLEKAELMIIERAWAMPNKRTFQIPPIVKLRREELLIGREFICDPFPFEGDVDCFDYLKTFNDESVEFVELDPPYTKRQVAEHYKKNGGQVTGWHTSSSWIAKVKNETARIMKPGGKVITYGYNSTGLGKSRGFEIIKILLVCHGAEHNDTICTVERKIQTTL